MATFRTPTVKYRTPTSLDELEVGQVVRLRWSGFSLPQQFGGSSAVIVKKGRKRVTVSSHAFTGTYTIPLLEVLIIEKI